MPEDKLPESEDRSLYDCPACGGSGLKDSANLCLMCSGTGKRPDGPVPGSYPAGTVVLKADGQYLVDENGQEVKVEK